MALLGEILIEKTDKISLRPGSVIGDVIIEKEYLQLRTYAMGDNNRERGSKQNIQFSKEKAKEFKEILEKFLDLQ
ncbi:hypothetical protein [Algoriphagus marincola]|uniref:hypothetical protein n=1 Tax=Algoriphagus marincola TaxID=264027 RepID=UPI00041EDF55|nr:hypothetical protein [Algoriphagus marincola]